MRITAPADGAHVPLEDIDLYDPRLYSAGDPHLAWRTLREKAQVFWQRLPDGREFWSVTAFDDEAHHQLFGYFADQVARRRRDPGDDLGDRDLIGRLMTMNMDGARLRDGEIVSNAYSALLGANVNTGHVVTAAIAQLFDDHAQYERWATDRRYFRSGVREALRWASPVIHFLRYAQADITLDDVTVPKGSGVVAWIPSANRDEDLFAHPYRFDISRRPNRQIAFGYGPHTCIGAAAAMITLHITFEEIFRCVERFEPASRQSIWSRTSPAASSTFRSWRGCDPVRGSRPATPLRARAIRPAEI